MRQLKITPSCRCREERGAGAVGETKKATPIVWPMIISILAVTMLPNCQEAAAAESSRGRSRRRNGQKFA